MIGDQYKHALLTEVGSEPGEPGGTAGPKKVDFIFPEVQLNPVCELSFDFNINVVSSTHTANIASVTYQIRTDLGAYVDIAENAISGWITSNGTNGYRYWIKCIQVRAIDGVGKGYNTLTLG